MHLLIMLFILGLEVQQTTTNSAYGIQQYEQSYEDNDYDIATSFHEE